MPSITQERVKQPHIKQEKGEHKSEFNKENKGNKSHSQSGAETEKASLGHGKGKYPGLGSTHELHHKSRGGHPNMRGHEFGGGSKGEGHHIKQITYRNGTNE